MNTLNYLVSTSQLIRNAAIDGCICGGNCKIYCLIFIWGVVGCLPILTAQNSIFTENALQGNPPSEWDISGAGDLDIQGYATDISYDQGETASFKITSPSDYTIEIYRLGYYNGDGARLIEDIPTIYPAGVQAVPTPDAVTGLVDCGVWTVSATWNIPATAVSGIYIAKLERTDNGGASHIAFIVRDDDGGSDILFKTSDATWQAYNGFGGNSLYTGTVPRASGNASKVSYNRPFLTRNGGAGGGAAEDWLFNAEYPMIRWLERNGYDVSYFTDIDADRLGSEILEHEVFLSVGHDEYWSGPERANVEAARDAGVHLAFFSGNEVYWRTRWEDNYRTLVCYKEGTLGENVCGTKCDPSPEWTGLWRDGCAYPSGDACDPENALSGQLSWDGTTQSMDVPGLYRNLRFWRNTSIANLQPTGTVTFPFGVLGYEWNWEQPQYAPFNPQGRILLSRSNRNGRTHQLSLYRHSSGALVFGAGTVQWSWGLDATHDRAGTPVNTDMQQATVNVLADMGVQPTTLQAGLAVAIASTDAQAPTTTITNPIASASLPVGNTVNVTGTASDIGVGVVAGVEISVDGGNTWQVATIDDIATNVNWSFSWIPITEGAAIIQSRAFDDSGNIGAATSVNVTIAPPAPPVCPCSIWNTQTIPQIITENDNNALEVGVKFRSTVAGFITGIRFYKSPQNVGPFTCNLWDVNGNNLASVSIIDPSATQGWREVEFNTPVAISANTTYIASYHTVSGFYSADEFFFQNQSISNPPLRALQDGEDGFNGVYRYSATSIFPNETFNSSNYWVDVEFVTEVGPDVIPPTVQSTSPPNNAVGVSVNTLINVTFSEGMNSATISGNSFMLSDGMSAVPATIAYNNLTRTATLTPSAPLEYSTAYTATIVSGVNGVKDLANNELAADFSWSFTTAAPPPLPPTDGPGGPILVISAAANPFSRYPVEILRAEGLNEFFAVDISQIDANLLDDYDVVILGEQPLGAAQVTLLTDWVNAGGVLITFRPDADLATLLGLTPTVGSLSEGYIQIANTGPGFGIVNETMQFHGEADYYTLNGATILAILYSDANTATVYPAVTTHDVGSGKAIAFTYDLAKSIVYTRQGNPAWAGQNRDDAVTDDVIRANDLFYGNDPNDPQPDWVDFNKIQIPQADEQQRFLANIIIQNNLQNSPLPRFWYFPNQFKAVVVMTGDDHAGGLTDEFFDTFISLSPQNCSVADWECVRGSSYVYTNTNIGGLGALAYQNLGFEVGIHINTGCNVWTPTSLVNDFDAQLAQFANNFPNIIPPCTHRTHCIAWSDWATQPKEQVARGIRLDVNYYYWPGSWLQNRPGLFTGSGMPMRFADLDGSLIDCYQVSTQFTDESGQDIALHINTLLDNAVGAPGYYGAFCANMHTDRQSSIALATTIIQAAQDRNVPTISSKQLLEWLDGRNGSSFENITWNNNQLSFSIAVGTGANNLFAMLPMNAENVELTSLTLNGNPVNFITETTKGIAYAFFPAAAGNYEATYDVPVTATLQGNVTLQGRTNNTATLTIKLYTPNMNTQIGSDFMATADANGDFTLPGLPAGTFDIYIKKDNYLQKILEDVTLPSGGNASEAFGQLLTGDANNDNFVTLADFSVLLNTFNILNGNPGFDARADFNGDGSVSLADFSLLLNNFNSAGAAPPN